MAAISISLGFGWWQDHESQSVEADAWRVEIKNLSSQTERLRAKNHDLIRFIDESYALLKQEGLHVQLDIDVDENGRYRLRADSVKLMDELKAKLQQLDGQPTTAPTDD